jgi:protein tyrosine phosphatase (PTP) superfamily phosphohydrolase (DUF442 family)
MDREDIIRMAREAGFRDTTTPVVALGVSWEQVQRFAALVAKHEREACASICFQEGPSIDGQLIAEAIRARGNT